MIPMTFVGIFQYFKTNAPPHDKLKQFDLWHKKGAKHKTQFNSAKNPINYISKIIKFL